MTVAATACPQCEAEGQPSQVIHAESFASMMNFPTTYDEEGGRHLHDGNITTDAFRCSRGHRWQLRRRLGTCWCGWKATDDYKD